LESDLAVCLADCADTNLARAIAGHATRLAHGELDESLLTVAAARATAGRPPTGSHMPPGEGQVLRLLADGMSIAGIAKQLFVSGSTAKTHISKL
jgi:DNA-binding NarL/FixJ family response regulator